MGGQQRGRLKVMILTRISKLLSSKTILVASVNDATALKGADIGVAMGVSLLARVVARSNTKLLTLIDH